MLVYELPLNEIVLDFYDRLKSARAAMPRSTTILAGFRVSPMVKLDVLVAGEPVDALSMIVHRDFAYERGKLLIERLRKLIPGRCSRSPSRRPSAPRSSRARTSRPSARTCSPSATAATSAASASCSRSRRKASAA
jgi:hypothetical protein